MGIILDKTAKVDDTTFKVHIERYDSVMKVADDLENRSVTDDRFNGHIDHSKISRNPTWYNVSSYEQALNLLHDGYEPQVTLTEINSISKSDGKRMSIQNDIVGFAPVIPLAMKGVPNCMLNTHIRPMKSKIIDVYFDATYNSNISADRMIENGKKILGAIVALEKSGYRINLYAVQTYSESGDEDIDVLTIKIKSSNQPFDLKRMSYPLMHPAFFRVIGFNWYAKCPGAKYRWCLGTALVNSKGYDRAKKIVKQVFGNNAIYISGTETLHNEQDSIKNSLIDEKETKGDK